MAALTLFDAAQITGTKPSTIFRAILSGHLSFTRDMEGSYKFEREEVERVFSPARRVKPAPIIDAKVPHSFADDAEAIFNH